MPYQYVLSDDEKRELLRIARATLKEWLSSGHVPPGAPHKQSLLAPAGVFVSLHDRDDLRGCIGTTAEAQPLYRAVQDMAVSAATRDPRFEPVRAEELNLVSIEISVLGGRRRVFRPEEIEVGKDGLHLVKGHRKGLLLPQVAVDQGWDASTFFGKTCEKAGLPRADWQSPEAVMEAFSAQVFDEKTLKAGPFGEK